MILTHQAIAGCCEGALGVVASNEIYKEVMPLSVCGSPFSCRMSPQAAVAAGIPVIGLTTGQSGEALLAAGASCVCRDFEEVMQMITCENLL